MVLMTNTGCKLTQSFVSCIQYRGFLSPFPPLFIRTSFTGHHAFERRSIASSVCWMTSASSDLDPVLAAAQADAAVAGGGSLGPATLGGYRSTASALSVYRQRQGVALDISSLPGRP